MRGGWQAFSHARAYWLACWWPRQASKLVASRQATLLSRTAAWMEMWTRTALAGSVDVRLAASSILLTITLAGGTPRVASHTGTGKITRFAWGTTTKQEPP